MASSLLSKISEFFGLDSESEYDDFAPGTDEYEEEVCGQSLQKEAMSGSTFSRDSKRKRYIQSTPSYSAIDESEEKFYGTPKIQNNGTAKVDTRRRRPMFSVPQEEVFEENDNVVSMQQAAKKVQQANANRKTASSPVNHQSFVSQKSSAQENALSFKIAIKDPRVYSEALDMAKLLMRGDAVLMNFHLMEEYAAGRVIDFLTGIVFALDGDIQRVGDEIFLVTPKNMEIGGELASSLLERSC